SAILICAVNTRMPGEGELALSGSLAFTGSWVGSFSIANTCWLALTAPRGAHLRVLARPLAVGDANDERLGQPRRPARRFLAGAAHVVERGVLAQLVQRLLD